MPVIGQGREVETIGISWAYLPALPAIGGLGHRFGHFPARSQAPPGTSSFASSACRVSVHRNKAASLARPGRQSLQPCAPRRSLGARPV